ncbi:beta-lactamase domain protein [Xylanimonas cellulosilytica DSM 15894]|uniref:Beta-lactamase domain protein n=1 Tax=Xylanimonas cellulosilytica (strain DSM 15894 / JCM 12276 / CECT 5975 / KCTC 9989 / LMG 20990 / NBRC 107835 / XIL07) TaxID=446471 RepID=D1BUT8_XYLCX|nr:MBL fold metallo-hydrolase [Xylanimonas cellulosilytica]ACZ29329.1 beta-lactamase domain protein [Xylanimonas cellulosilytica DSM 15894]
MTTSTTTETITTSDHLTFGEVTVSRVVESVGSIGMTPDQFFPGTDPDAWVGHEDELRPYFLENDGETTMASTARVAMQTWILRSGGRTVLLDACVGNDKDRPDVPGWSHLRTAFLGHLAAAGVTPESVDVVVNTHLHADHVGWNTRLTDGAWVPSFPNAEYLMPAEDLEFWDPARNRTTVMGPGAHRVWADSIAPVVAAGQVTAWSGSHRIDDALTLEAAPGHTPGASILRLVSGDDEVLFLGDTLHSPAQVQDVHTSSCFDEDPAQAHLTRARLFTEAAEKNLLLLPAHFAGHGGFRVEQSGDAFRIVGWAGLTAV